jgi:hypothetical protein
MIANRSMVRKRRMKRGRFSFPLQSRGGTASDVIWLISPQQSSAASGEEIEDAPRRA